MIFKECILTKQKTAYKKPNPYKVMTSVLTTYKPTYDEKMTINSFFMCRYLSNHPRGVFVSNMINRYYNVIPLNVQYDIAKQLLKGKIKFIQQTSKPKVDTKLLDNISRYYKINEQHAIEYLELMGEEQIEDFRTLYDGN